MAELLEALPAEEADIVRQQHERAARTALLHHLEEATAVADLPFLQQCRTSAQAVRPCLPQVA